MKANEMFGKAERILDENGIINYDITDIYQNKKGLWVIKFHLKQVPMDVEHWYIRGRLEVIPHVFNKTDDE